MGKAGIYARLSLADEKSTSTRRQEKECRDHAAALGRTIKGNLLKSSHGSDDSVQLNIWGEVNSCFDSASHGDFVVLRWNATPFVRVRDS